MNWNYDKYWYIEQKYVKDLSWSAPISEANKKLQAIK